MTIETPRLLLRPLHEEDAQMMFDNWASDPEVTRYLFWNAHEDISMTRYVLSRWEEEEKDPSCIRFGIEVKEDHQLIGSIDVVRYVDGVPEVGYCMSRRYWGKGIMTEACKAFLEHLKNRGFHKVIICAYVDNIGSNRVIQKCGLSWVKEVLIDVPLKNLHNVRINWYEKQLD
ncbi:MAG: GNAT family N-acetyltransferase [Bacilli bacterium]|nr:GNAT family N-acetyltransferase [Bacilli bacterium]